MEQLLQRRTINAINAKNPARDISNGRLVGGWKHG